MSDYKRTGYTVEVINGVKWYYYKARLCEGVIGGTA